MRLTKQTSHAIRILIECANAGNVLVKAGEISGQLDITQQNTFKIVHLLSRAGFIVAVRGPKGGVRLARPASEIRIGDVVRATEATSVEVEAETGARSRPRGGRKINAIFDDALEAFISVLDQHTVEDMARSRPGMGRADRAPEKKKSRLRSVSAASARSDRVLRQTAAGR